MILTGRGKAFAAGADIKQMLNMSYADHHKRLHLHHWSRPSRNIKVDLLIFSRASYIELIIADYSSCKWLCIRWWMRNRNDV